MPSAPLPWSIVSSNESRRPAEGTAVGQNAVPAAAVTAGVNTSDDPDSVARPFTCHPPAHGAGIGVDVEPTVIVTVPVPVAPRLSVAVSVAMYEPLAV